jgi:hypothetical protein
MELVEASVNPMQVNRQSSLPGSFVAGVRFQRNDRGTTGTLAHRLRELIPEEGTGCQQILGGS